MVVWVKPRWMSRIDKTITGIIFFLKSSLMIVFFAALNAAVKWELQESKVKDMM